jgi:hypothetical protein
MFHGSLVVTLECADSPLSYLVTSSPALHVTHAPLCPFPCRPYGFLINSQGRIIMSDGDNHRVQVLQ